MFKKLKQKIEEGGDVGLERSSFRLPGSIVRENSGDLASNSEIHPRVIPEVPPEPDSNSHSPENLNRDEQSGQLPEHLGSSSHRSYQAVLEKKIQELEKECLSLKEQLNQQSLHHTAVVAALEKQISQLEQMGANLKMQIVEFELEKIASHQEHEIQTNQLEAKLLQLENSITADSAKWNYRVNKLEAEIEEKEKCIIEEENKCTALEKKCKHYESQLKAYEVSSDNEVVSRLHCEVADVEQRIKSRNLEIQILERRLASQTRENQDQVERMLQRQEELEQTNQELAQVTKEERKAKKEIMAEMELIQQAYAESERLQEELKRDLSIQEQLQQRVALECEELKSSHASQIQEIEQLMEDKNKHIKELGRQLKLLGNDRLSEPLLHPPGVARRTASIAIQTSELESAVLEEPNHQGPSPSVSSEDALELLKQKKCALDEELAEKLKIIKVQQQRIMDLKKELRLQATSSEPPSVLVSEKCSPAPLRVAIASDVNFQYLKHVVIKFMCSREDEALQLIRAVATLLEFSPQEEEHVKGYLNYKMSWFGVIPPPSLHQCKLNESIIFYFNHDIILTVICACPLNCDDVISMMVHLWFLPHSPQEIANVFIW